MEFLSNPTEFIWGFLVYIVTKETGFLIGFGLFLYASSYLPEDVRAHVRTVGISIAVYQLAKNYWFRKQWEEAEAERERLKGEKEKLEQRGEALMQELDRLNQHVSELDQRIVDLRQQRKEMEDKDDFNPDEFDQKIDQLKQQSASLQDRIKALPTIMRKVGETTRQLDASVQ